MKNFSVISIVFSILLVVFGLTLSAQSSDDKNACTYARKDSSIDTWKFYLENFPNGECADEAKAALEGARNAKDQIACNQARQQNSYVAWSKYLDNFPDGKCNFEAKMMQKKLIGQAWSSRSSEQMTWNEAINYCKNLNEGGYTDWRLPNIDELRTLIQNHSGTQTGGTCPISEKAGKLALSDRTSDCNGRAGSNFSKLGDTGWFWSSSTRSGNTDYAWGVNFYGGYVDGNSKTYYYYVRCVR